MNQPSIEIIPNHYTNKSKIAYQSLIFRENTSLFNSASGVATRNYFSCQGSRNSITVASHFSQDVVIRHNSGMHAIQWEFKWIKMYGRRVFVCLKMAAKLLFQFRVFVNVGINCGLCNYGDR